MRVTVGPPIPLPDSATLLGPAALSLITTVARFPPLRVAVKLALIVHCALGCKVPGHPLTMGNAPGLLDETLAIVAWTGLRLLTVIDLLAVAAPPTLVVPKPRDRGWMPRKPCLPVPIKLTLCAPFFALLVISNIARRTRRPLG